MKVIFTWGRMNPPTRGHEKLVKKVKQLASKYKCDARVYLTHSQDKKKNPLTYVEKIKYAKEAFGSVIHKSEAKTIIQVLQELEKSYNEITFVAGSDRTNEFHSLLLKYNGKEYFFDRINVVSCGERDPDADDDSAISGTVVRTSALANDVVAVSKAIPTGIHKYKDDIIKTIQERMT